LPNLIVLDYKP